MVPTLMLASMWQPRVSGSLSDPAGFRPSKSSAALWDNQFEIRISCKEPDWQLSSIEQVCKSFFPTFSTVEDLYIKHEYSELDWKDDVIENSLWVEVLLPFTSVKNLYLFNEFALSIATALEDLVGESMTELLPSLQNIFVMGLEESGSIPENIRQFVAARQLSNRPISISVWDT